MSVCSVRLSFCLSVCLFTNLFQNDSFCSDLSTVTKLNIYITHHSRRPLMIDFWVKRSMVKVTGQGSLHMATNSFRDDNSCFDQSIILKLHTCITYHSGKTPINFTLKISKVKLTGEDCLQICFRMITPVRINNCFQTLPFYHPSPITHERSLLILGSKSRSQVRAFPPPPNKLIPK